MSDDGRVDVESIEFKIGQKIRKYREDMKMSQFALSERVGVSEPTIRRIESGKTSVDFVTLIKIAKVQKRTPNDYMLDEDIDSMCMESPVEYKELSSEEKSKFWKANEFTLAGIRASRR